ncbi:MAG: glycosyltransferase family 4 protein [Candidatus Aenigmatarchaeota archaeon]
MRIGFFCWESLHSIPVGGMGVAVTELAAALQRKGNEVHVFTRIGQNQKVYEVVDGVHYHRCPFNFSPNFFYEMTNNMCKSMAYHFFETENVSGAFDIVHGHDWQVVNALDEIKKTRNKRIVFTLHSTQFGRDGNHFYNGVAKDITNLEWYGTYIAEKVTVCSNIMREEVKKLYRIPEDKLRVVPNGIWARNFDGFIDAWKDVKSHLGIGVYDPMITFVGRMTIQKGPDLLIEAIPDVLKDFPNAKFVFVGDGYMKSQIENRVGKLGIQNVVRFTGHVTNEWKTKIMKASECIVVPSRNEPFGIVVLEAWSCYKPVIATHGTGGGELIWHDVTGYRVYQAPNSIAWGIKEILRNPEHARWMGKNGRYAAENTFTWDKAAEKLFSVYEEIVR